jgi:hypothetical protein
MTWLALGISILAVVMTFFFRSKNQTMSRALKAAQDRETEMTKTLVDILDEDNNIRGQLMLPGKVPTDEAIVKLNEATEAMSEMLEKLNKERVNKKDIEMLVELVNNNGASAVQIRLPGEKVYPTKTPCGDLCKHSFWAKKEWNCNAGRGNSCDNARPRFLDAEKQCIMFERSANH